MFCVFCKWAWVAGLGTCHGFLVEHTAANGCCAAMPSSRSQRIEKFSCSVGRVGDHIASLHPLKIVQEGKWPLLQVAARGGLAISLPRHPLELVCACSVSCSSVGSVRVPDRVSWVCMQAVAGTLTSKAQAQLPKCSFWGP